MLGIKEQLRLENQSIFFVGEKLRIVNVKYMRIKS